MTHTFTDELSRRITALLGEGRPFLLDGYRDYEPPPRVRHPSERLRERRRDLIDALTEPEDGFIVVAYALTTTQTKPDHTLARVQAYADFRGWRAYSQVLWDGCGMSHPLERTDWLRAERLVAGGFAHGIVTLDQSAVTASTREYSEVLDRLRDCMAFLAHVPDEWQQPAPQNTHRGGTHA